MFKMLLNTTFITGILFSYYEKITNAMIFLIIPNAKSCEGNDVFDASIDHWCSQCVSQSVRNSVLSFVNANPLKPPHGILWYFVGIKDTICRCPYYQDSLILGGILAFLKLEFWPNIQKINEQFLSKTPLNQSAARHFVKLCRYSGHNVWMRISLTILPVHPSIVPKYF